MKLVFFTLVTLIASSALAQCADTANIYVFSLNSTTYEVVKENKTWKEAAACAVERNGYLADISDSAEQAAVYHAVKNLAGINPANTIAPDGGGASYVWLGGNDMATEGHWVWDGNNDGNGLPFWQGKQNGSPLNNAYTNWGNEPDDFQGQDALGLALTDWPLGVAGQWNDIDENNKLYFVIEMPLPVGINEAETPEIDLYPVPATQVAYVSYSHTRTIKSIRLLDVTGRQTASVSPPFTGTSRIDLTRLAPGVYFVEIRLRSGKVLLKKLVKSA